MDNQNTNPLVFSTLSDLELALENRDAEEFIAQETLGAISEIVREDGTGNLSEVSNKLRFLLACVDLILLIRTH